MGRAASIVEPGTVSLGLSARGTTNGVDWLYQSAAHGLYERVAHRRALVLLGAGVPLVIDRLTSDEPRDFAQLWHITPDAALSEPIELGSGTFHVAFMSSMGAGDAPLFSLHQSGGSMPPVAHVYQGEPARVGVPGMGWISTAEGQLTSHPVVEFLRSAVTDAAFGSVFLLGELAAERAKLMLEERGAHGNEPWSSCPDSAWRWTWRTSHARTFLVDARDKSLSGALDTVVSDVLLATTALDHFPSTC